MEDLSRSLVTIDQNAERKKKLFNVNFTHEFHTCIERERESLCLVNWIPFECIVIKCSIFDILSIGHWMSDMDFVFNIPF